MNKLRIALIKMPPIAKATTKSKMIKQRVNRKSIIEQITLIEQMTKIKQKMIPTKSQKLMLSPF